VSDSGDVEAFYRRYLDACNAHDFNALDRFVAADVDVNGERQGLSDYVAGLERLVRGFPDYHWDPRHLMVDGDRIAPHFIDTGTHRGQAFGVPATGRSVRIQEFAFYRLADGLIAEVWVAADNLALLRQIS
jgi:aspartyl-tRNA synthetase